MLTISKPLAAGQAIRYHREEFSNAKTNYFTEDNRIRGEWQGRLAQEWGLQGEVQEEQFARLLNSAAVLVRFVGPRATLIGFAAFALLMYCGVAPAGWRSLRHTLGWTGARPRCWLEAALRGGSLGLATTAVTAAFGHPIRIVETTPNQVLAATLAPIAEEVLLRGLLLPLLRRIINDSSALALSSVLFAALHWPSSWLKLVSITAAGVVYGLIRIRAGSTALAAVAHTAYNATILLIGLSQSS